MTTGRVMSHAKPVEEVQVWENYRVMVDPILVHPFVGVQHCARCMIMKRRHRHPGPPESRPVSRCSAVGRKKIQGHHRSGGVVMD